MDKTERIKAIIRMKSIVYLTSNLRILTPCRYIVTCEVGETHNWLTGVPTKPSFSCLVGGMA